jgi:hypothetical protein
MISLSILVRKFYHAAKFVCPLITVFCFYYFCVVDFHGAIMPVYNVIVVGTAITYLLLTYFIENWLVQAAISIPIFSILTWRQSFAVLEQQDKKEISFRCIFLIIVYSAVAYRLDRLHRLAFLSKQSNDNSFNRWLRVFESFPEGIALIRHDEEIVYTN